VKKLIITFLAVYLLASAFFYFFQNQIIFHEKELDKAYQFHFPQKFKELWLETSDNTKVNSLYFFSDSIAKKGIVVYYHGNADNLARWGKYAKDFTKNGYDVLMIDYRGFGKSKGDFSEKGLMTDANAAYKYAKKLFPENKIIVYGRSLGSGIATQIAAANAPKMLLLETPYVNFPDIAYHFVPIIPFHILSNYQFETDKFISKVPCPIHLFHGTDDGLVYYESSLKLCKILEKKPDEILTTITGGEHKNLSDFPEYHVALANCLAN
jgi:uncharacterized protein